MLASESAFGFDGVFPEGNGRCRFHYINRSGVVAVAGKNAVGYSTLPPARSISGSRFWCTVSMASIIDWIEEDDSVHCRIPPLFFSFVKVPGIIGMVVSVFFAVFFSAFMIMLFLTLPDDAPRALIMSVFAGFLGLFLIPVGGFIFCKSLLVVCGRKRLELNAKQICVITQLGPIWSRRKCQLASLGGFRIEDLKGEKFNMAVGYSNLVAVQQDGREVHLLRAFANEIVGQLVEEIPGKIELVTRRMGGAISETILASEVQTELSAPDPFRIQQRTSKPIGSDLTIQENGLDRVLDIPPRGLLKSTPVPVRYVSCAVLCFILVAVGGLVATLLAGKVEGQPAVGWLFAGLFTFIAVLIVLYRISAAIRRGSIRIGRNSMSFREQSLFSRHEVTWDRDAIDAVRVAVEEHVGDESVTYEHFIEVIADTGRPRHWFSHRDKRELEWLVHKIQEALGLDVSET